MPDQYSCPICSDSLDNEAIFITLCDDQYSHSFCLTCFTKYSSNSGLCKCPQCRHIIRHKYYSTWFKFRRNDWYRRRRELKRRHPLYKQFIEIHKELPAAIKDLHFYHSLRSRPNYSNYFLRSIINKAQLCLAKRWYKKCIRSEIAVTIFTLNSVKYVLNKFSHTTQCKFDKYVNKINHKNNINRAIVLHCVNDSRASRIDLTDLFDCDTCKPIGNIYHQTIKSIKYYPNSYEFTNIITHNFGFYQPSAHINLSRVSDTLSFVYHAMSMNVLNVSGGSMNLRFV